MLINKPIWQTVIEVLIFPPAFNILLIVIGLILMKSWFRFSLFLIIASLVLLYILSMNVVALHLARGLIKYPVMTPESVQKHPDAKAIVVLSGGHGFSGKPYTLQRLETAAYLQKLTKLPILISGYRSSRYMKVVLKNEMGSHIKYIEDRSKSTWQNAVFSAKLLRSHKIKSFYLVTNGWHMKRSMWCFEKQGLHPIPAPAGGKIIIKYDRFQNWLPSASALTVSVFSLHEYIGGIFYRWKH
jgi:uncharacterized SAM-binding protein YcdF (DUF218 family)